MAETRDKDGVLDSREAGKFLRDILEERGWQIQQLAERTTVPDPDYLSNLLSGRVNVGKSKHFPSIAKALGLNAEDVAYVNPNLIVQVAAPSRSAALSAHAMGYRGPKPERTIPESLKEAARLFGNLPAFADLLKPAWQTFLVDIPRRKTPTTAEEWKNEYTQLKAMGYGPDETE